ncbi:MAG: hemolysin III family protein [Myxococcaceae bacterium]
MISRFKTLRDPVSGLTHLAGALLGIAGLIYLLIKSSNAGTARHIVSSAIFGTSVILLYTSSAFYHLLNISDEARVIFRKLDHSMIFVLIAGSYTPFCLIALHGYVGWILFGVIWGLVIVGLFVKFYWLHAPRWISTGIYLLMGWIAMIVFSPLSHALTPSGFFWLITGGLFYTIGAVIYALKRPNPFPNIFGFHEIWHLFVLAGTASHFMSINSLAS